MGEIKLFISDKIKQDGIPELIRFLQGIIDRRTQGFCRYGPCSPGKQYADMIHHEYQQYQKTGCAEQLYNIAVYCGLEMRYPQHSQFHHNSAEKSANPNRRKERKFDI